jgi:hypothetical protein
LLIWNLKICRGSTRIKDKKQGLLIKSHFFPSFLTWVALEL